MDTQERHLYFTLLIAALFLTVLLLIFTITILKKHRKHRLVNKDKVSTEISTLEIERKRMAYDLHDDIGPLLSSIKLQINCLSNADEEDREIIERCSTLIGDAIQKIRETSNNLTSEILSRKGLTLAIREFSDMISKTKQLEIDIDIPAVETQLNKSSELHLYRIFQEVLTNCIRHAQATKFYLQIIEDKKLMTITLNDNGIGFDSSAVQDKLGFGLKNIVNRVDLLNGQLYLDAQKDKGVCYTIEIPLE